MCDAAFLEVGEPSVVHLVSDDTAFSLEVAQVLTPTGHALRHHASHLEFIGSAVDHRAGCVILDVDAAGCRPALPGLLARCAEGRPVIAIAANPSACEVVAALKAGACDYILKPVDGAVLGAAIEAAVDKDTRRRAEQQLRAVLMSRYWSLTDREREVARLVGAGLPNSEVATAIGVAERTVKVYRAAAMDKMKAHRLPDLVRALGVLRVSIPDDARKGIGRCTPGQLRSSSGARDDRPVAGEHCFNEESEMGEPPPR